MGSLRAISGRVSAPTRVNCAVKSTELASVFISCLTKSHRFRTRITYTKSHGEYEVLCYL